jgi:hypothetical protein
MPPQRSRPGALRLQIEELAALVAGVAGQEDGEPDKGEQEGYERSAGQRDQRAAGEGVGAQPLLDRSA